MSARSCAELGWELTGRFCGAQRIDGHCSGQRTYRNATSFCAAAGSRLCTAAELAQRPMKNGGCGLNDELVWTSSSCEASTVRRIAMFGKGRGEPQCMSEEYQQLQVGCCADEAAQASDGSGRAVEGAPSFVLVMPDDYPRSLLGAAHGLTPTLDRLRQQGLSFERAYTTAPLCSPSRYCVLTGRHASTGLMKAKKVDETKSGGGAAAAAAERGGVRDIAFQNLGMDRAHGTIASRLGGLGYATAFVGKWHLGTQLGTPSRDDSANNAEVRRAGYGWAGDVYYDNDAMDRRAHQPEWMAAEAVRWLRWAGARRRPFFLHMAPTVTHSPLRLAEQLRERPRAAPPEGGPPPPLPGEAGAAVDLAGFERGASELRGRVAHALTKAGVLCEVNGTAALCERLPELSVMLAPQPWLPLPTLQPWEGPVARYAPLRELCRVQFKGKNHDACQNHPHFGAMLGYAHWLDATLQPVPRHAEEAGRQAGGAAACDISGPRGAVRLAKEAALAKRPREGHATPFRAQLPRSRVLTGGTLFIFTSDHGDGYTDKGHAYEPGIRVPLFFSPLGDAPTAAADLAMSSGGTAVLVQAGRWRRGGRVEAPVTHLDLRPTLLALAEGAGWAGSSRTMAEGVGGTAGSGNGGSGGSGSDEGGADDAPQSLHALLLEPRGAALPAAARAQQEQALEKRPVFVEAGYSRAVLAGKWKLIVKMQPPGSCSNPHGDNLDGYLRQLARVAAAAAAAPANASARQVFGAVTAARKGVERRDMEVRLLYSAYLRHPASYCDAVQLFDTAADPAELRNLASHATQAPLTQLAATLSGLVERLEPLSSFRLPPKHEWHAGDDVPAILAGSTPWKSE